MPIHKPLFREQMRKIEVITKGNNPDWVVRIWFAEKPEYDRPDYCEAKASHHAANIKQHIELTQKMLADPMKVRDVEEAILEYIGKYHWPEISISAFEILDGKGNGEVVYMEW